MLVLLLTGVLLLQSGKVQTAIVKRVTTSLNEKIDGEINVGEIKFYPFKTLILKNVTITDKHPLDSSFFAPRDTVARIDMATCLLSYKGLAGGNGIRIKRATLQGGEFNLVIEGNRKNNLKRVFGLTGPKPLENKGDVFFLDKFEVKDFKFTMASIKGDGEAAGEGRVSWRDLSLDADAVGHGFKIENGHVHGIVDDLAFSEKSGYETRNVHGEVCVKRSLAEITGFGIEDNWSEIHMPEFSMAFDNYLSFHDFMNAVSLKGKIEDSHIDINTLGSFADLEGLPLALDIKDASFDGPVGDIRISNLEFSEDHGISGLVGAELKGLPDIGRLQVKADIGRLDFTTGSLEALLKSISPDSKLKLASFAPDQELTLTGTGGGPVNDLNFTGRLDSGIGSANGVFNVKNLASRTGRTDVSGSVETEDVNIGGIIGSDLIKELTMRTSLKASLGKEGSELGIDSLYIDRLNVLGYDYSNIAAAGTLLDNSFNGRIVCSDPNLNFLFQGIFNLSKKTNNALYKFYFNLGYFDLNAVHLDKRGPSKASLALNANFMRIRKGDLIGNIEVKDLVLENKDGLYQIGNSSIGSYSNNNSHRVTFNSSFAEGNYVGTRPITSLFSALKEVSVEREIPALTNVRPKIWEGDEYRVSFKTADSRDLLAFIAPGAYIADGTDIRLAIDKEGTMNASILSQRLAFHDKFLKNLDFRAKDNGDGLKCSLNSKELNLTSVKFLENTLTANADDDRIDLKFSFDNGGKSPSYGSLSTLVGFERDADGTLLTNIASAASDICAKGEKWTIEPSSVELHGKKIDVNSFRMVNGEQDIKLFGSYSKNQADTLNLKINKLKLGPLMAILGKFQELDGVASGNAELISDPEAGIELLGKIISEQTTISGYDAGTIRMGSFWNEERKQMEFSLRNELFGGESINASGAYTPASRDIKAKVKLKGFELGYASGLARSVFSELEGKAQGEISIAGPLDNISIYSRGTRLDDAKIKVAYTGVPYFLNGPFSIDDHGIKFEDISIKDRYKGSGTVSGGVAFENLKNIRMMTRLRVSGLEAFDTEDDGESPVYGQVSASGTVTIDGPFSAIVMGVDASTSGNGDFHIPLRSSDVSSTNLLTFKEPENTGWVDPYEEMIKKLDNSGKKAGGLQIKMNVNVRPEVLCHLEIDKSGGNIVSGRGYGTINIGIGAKDNPFSIRGDYNLNNGNFHFNAMDLASRNFNIRSGSNIKFNGDIMDSDLDIDATYMTKATLSNLIVDTTSVSSRRNVICGLDISDKLRNPQLGFSIDIPDLDPTTKSQVESALNTDDKVQKQFLSLLLTNNFIPDFQSGIVNNTNLLFSNVMEIMSGQLSNILQSLDIPLDLGLQYQSNEGGTDIFDVAVSTQLFNNRVSVNGNIGNRQYNTGNAGQDVAGDLDIDIKVDKAGAVKVSLFSHSADPYTNYLDYSQRNGIGIGYQKEFNTIYGFLRSLFLGKNGREAMKRFSPREEKVTFNIDGNE